MLSASNRLSKEKDFETVHQKGRFWRGESLALKFALNNLPDSRFGIIVSNKISPKPTVRNQIKRRIREIIRLNLKEQKLKNGFDVIVFTKPPIVKKNYSEIETELLNLFKQIKLYQPR